MVTSDGYQASAALRRQRIRMTLRVRGAWAVSTIVLGLPLPLLAQPEAKKPAADEAAANEAAASGEAADGDTTASDTAASGANGDSQSTEGEAAASETSEASSSDASAETSSDVEVGVEVGTGGGLFESAVSGADSAAGDDASAGAPSGFALNGYVRSDVFIGKVPDFDRSEIKAAYGELALKLSVNKESHGDAFAEMRLRYGQQGRDNELVVDLREAYVNAYLGDFDLRLGKQIVVWGRADAFNPTNNVTPVDLRVRSPIEDDRRLGNVGLRTFWNLLPVRVEGIWMPLYAPVEIPKVPFPEYVVQAPPDYPTPDLADGVFAGRVHLELSSFEGSVSYLHGFAPMPGLALQSYVAGDAPEVRVSRTAYNHDVIGADFSTAVGDYGLRAEAAYRKPLHFEERVYAPRPDLQYVAGIDREFGQLSLILQYAGRYVFDWQEDEPGVFGPSALTAFQPPVTQEADATIRERADIELRHRNQVLFQQTAEVQHMVSLRAAYLAMQDTLSLSALGLMNVTTSEWLLYPKLSYKFSDNMSGSLGGEIYVGPDGSLLDLIQEELSAGYAELRFGF